ncbi:hypothetical protein LshimejAT787_0302580 [Lyophyllum shimeji]|uniref:Uncharacterized protein n=1 Tax=Lyophyllum shimeji TaxID=47721 RepID=A0A9P3PH45_LYOSH|nr:hypothetical protein LshimejAT787_0302580 [Lyophyllum shimeji]
MHILPKALTSTLYDDPAFSDDPQAHPFFATPSAPWLTDWARPPPLPVQDTDEFQLLQPPNTPMFSDDHSSTTHETSSSSNHTSTTSTSLSSPPTSTDSHSSPWTPLPSEKVAQPLPWPPETQKKKKNITMFWRRTPPETVLQSVNLARNATPEPSPPPQTGSRPAPARNATAPEKIKPANRPTLPPRPVTTAADSKPPPTASRRIIGGRAIRAHELDRIDELDESNPLGLPLHHGGPYEAVQKSISQETNEESASIGSQYQLQMAGSTPIAERKQDRDKPPKRNQPQLISSVPIVPAGVSLNLSPGQILPRNFYHQLNQNAVAGFGSSEVPGWPPRPQASAYSDTPESRHQAGEGHLQEIEQEFPVAPDYSRIELFDGSQDSGRLPNATPEHPVIPQDSFTMKRDRRSLPSKIPSFLPPSQESLPGYDQIIADDARRLNRHSAVEFQQHSASSSNGQHPPEHRGPGPGHRHGQSNPRLPPRMQALQMQTNRPDETHRRSPRPYTGAQEISGSQTENIPFQPSHRRRSQAPGQALYTPLVEPEQLPPLVDNNGFPASSAIPPSFELPQLSFQDQLQRNFAAQRTREQGTMSSQRSITHSSRSTNSGNSRTSPPPNHLPKRLVMPAPLQPTQVIAPRHQPPHPQVSQHLDAPIWQAHLRSPSPAMVSTALGAYTNGQPSRNEDALTAQSRKLRKRHSVQGLPVPLISPSQPLSFEPTTLYTEILPPHAALSARKLEKTPKRVLSKRRTDF